MKDSSLTGMVSDRWLDRQNATVQRVILLLLYVKGCFRAGQHAANENGVILAYSNIFRVTFYHVISDRTTDSG